MRGGSGRTPGTGGSGGGGVELSNATPAAIGTATPGTSEEAARADHVHAGGGGGGYQASVVAGEFVVAVGSADDPRARLKSSGGYPALRSWDDSDFSTFQVRSVRLGDFGSTIDTVGNQSIRFSKPVDIPEGVPSQPPFAGVRLYVESGVLKAMKPDGSSVTIG